MRTVALLLATLLPHICVSSVDPIDTDALYDAWRAAFHPGAYETTVEESQRRSIVIANLLRARQRNNDAQDSAVYGGTRFSDLTPAEFKDRFLSGYAPAQVPVTATAASTPTAAELAAAAPVDWVAKGAVTPIKSQGVCGSCWSFATTGNIEGQVFLQSKQLRPLSEQQLIDCDRVAPNNGCNGGNPNDAFEWLMAQPGGIATEASYAYSGFQSTCVNDSSIHSGAHVANWTTVSTNQTEIAAVLAARGPLAVGVNAAGLQQYRGGVSCPVAALCDPATPNHAMLLVGWGVDKGGQEYWKVKNSWGVAFGEEGYWRVCKGQGACGINRYVSTASIV